MSDTLKFLILQHHDTEHPGSLRPMLAADAVCDIVRLHAGQRIPDISGYDGMLAFGGPMDVWEVDQFPWLREEKAAIRRFVIDYRRPYLGVCLGHQLLADALGGQVGKMAVPEVGVRSVHPTPESRGDSLVGGAGETFPTVQWHGAEVKCLPPNSTLLATNEACPIQAFRSHDLAYGVQYHVEVEPNTIAEWGAIPAYSAALREIAGDDGQPSFERAAQACMGQFTRAATQLYQGFRDLAAEIRASRAA